MKGEGGEGVRREGIYCEGGGRGGGEKGGYIL